jgi:hypothetical protein
LNFYLCTFLCVAAVVALVTIVNLDLLQPSKWQEEKGAMAGIHVSGGEAVELPQTEAGVRMFWIVGGQPGR